LPITSIDVSFDGCRPGDLSQPVDHFGSANVPGVNDVVGPCKLLDRLAAQQTVGIGDYADPHQGRHSALTNFGTNSSFTNDRPLVLLVDCRIDDADGPVKPTALHCKR
jgi:hypothetical protein